MYKISNDVVSTINFLTFFERSQQFNTIGDFTMENKCVHVNDGCDLQPTKTDCCNTIEKSSASDKELTNIGYVTANSLVQKSTLERSISDSVVSLKNYSTILHNSNNTLYKTQSPNSVAKTLERQTSTPMHQNLLVFKSPETNGCCASCSISSSSSQISSIHSSSESDTSPQAIMESNETRYFQFILFCLEIIKKKLEIYFKT